MKKIIVHCSDSEFGDATVIDSWHKARGWQGIGYHYVICNGILKSGGNFIATYDGKVQTGRPEAKMGSHCLGHNILSVGICLIGKHKFTEAQFTSLRNLIVSLRERYGKIPIYGHYQLDKTGKTCPNFNVEKWLKENNLS